MFNMPLVRFTLLALLFLPIPLGAQWTLFGCAANSKDYVVGAKLPPSGLFFKKGVDWIHAGYNHPFLVALDYAAEDPSTLYLAAGNGLIRAANGGQDWTILTGSDVTELRDVAVDQRNPGTIYFAHSHGIRVTHDRGKTWQELAGSLHRKYAETIRIDRAHPEILLMGGEEGIFRSDDAGKEWRIAGAAGLSILRLEQSPHNACYWLAATQGGGLFSSNDCGKTFENDGRIGVGRNLYGIAFDPVDAQRIAVAGWGPGVAISEDGGKTWQARNTGLPRADIWSVVFDPEHAGRLYASVQEEAVYVSDNAGKDWRRDGLDDSVAWHMKFVPETPTR
jgi:photosystem II stability/assembly factor-like uncharacterized protein